MSAAPSQPSTFAEEREAPLSGKVERGTASADEAPGAGVGPTPATARSVSSAALEFLAVGGATLLLYPLSYGLRALLGLDAAELAVGFTMFHAAHLINDPHFAVTYLLFYEDARGRAFGASFGRAQRLRWLAVGIVIPLVMIAWALGALATRSAPMLAALVQLMFFLVGWHYVKQGFGVLTILAARRGTSLSVGTRRALLAHAYAGWAYAWASPADLGTEVEEKGVVYRTLAHGPTLERVTFAIFVFTLAPVVVLLVRTWRREGRFPLAVPLLAFLVSIWAWSVYSSVDPLVRYMVPALHSVQYLYMVWLLKRNRAAEREGPPWFESRVASRLGLFASATLVLGFVLFHGLPSALDDLLTPRSSRFTDLGPTPWFAAIYAFVNLHHYFMDAVLWRRENPLTRYLRADP